MSPGVFNFADDQALINAHGEAKNLEDGPSAADYDPTADMKEDELRDERRHGNVGLHGEPRRASLAEATAPAAPEKGGEGAKKDDDDDDFDMFADDFADKFAAPVTSKPDATQEARPQPGGGGGILEGDDKEGYYKIRPGELLEGRYQVSTTLGRGMFSGVARAVDITTKKEVAIKIMRNNDALRKGGFTEIAILEKLNAADPDDKKHIVRFERAFEYKAHLCMAFENLSMNLREVLKKFGNNVGINLNATRAYAYQIFLALGHMRKCSIIHADLKPDNILVSRCFPVSQGLVADFFQVNEARNVLKICDLGTAIDRSDAATAATEPMPYLVSRFYRAPEVILGVPFDYAVDMWSIGCTLYELYTGKILFTGENNNQMLKNIMEIRGKLSAKLYKRGELAHNHFDELGNFISVERDKILGKVSNISSVLICIRIFVASSATPNATPERESPVVLFFRRVFCFPLFFWPGRLATRRVLCRSWSAAPPSARRATPLPWRPGAGLRDGHPPPPGQASAVQPGAVPLKLPACIIVAQTETAELQSCKAGAKPNTTKMHAAAALHGAPFPAPIPVPPYTLCPTDQPTNPPGSNSPIPQIHTRLPSSLPKQ